MAEVLIDDLVVCMPCAHVIANDEGTEDHRIRMAEHWEDTVERFSDATLVLANGPEEEAHFSSRRCDSCGDDDHGDRLPAVLIGS